MKEKTADLHIHSYYSDGTMSPEEILAGAIKKGVGLISLTDHDILEGTAELQELCLQEDIHYLPGVELDTLEKGINYHVLAYGINLKDVAFSSFVKGNRKRLDTVNSKLIEKMEKDVPTVSMSDYEAYRYDRRKGGWKALHYLMEKGFTVTLREGLAYYAKYECDYDCVDFPSIQTVCEQIHKAGGKAVLAHPGVSITEKDPVSFKNKLEELVDYGLDGIECYYMTHTEEITKLCLTLCEERDLIVTAGSDCHGSFGKADIGDVNIPIRQLRLKDLLLL